MKGILMAFLAVCSLAITVFVLFFVVKFGPKINSIGEVEVLEFMASAKFKLTDSIDNVVGYVFKAKDDNYKKAFNTSRILAIRKDPQALFNLGYMYENGKFIFEDNFRAKDYYEQAADLNYAPAQVNLANMYFHGYTVRKDYDKAIKLYEAAAKQNNAVGQYNLAVMYYNGYGVKQDYEKAFELLQNAAEKGVLWADYVLGGMYYEGNGTKKNEQKAEKHFLKAGRAGYKRSQEKLGRIYESKKDYKKAFYWYSKAAEQNDAPAQYKIWYFYQNGLGVKQDLKKAEEYLLKSSSLGYAPARELYIEREKKRKQAQEQELAQKQRERQDAVRKQTENQKRLNNNSKKAKKEKQDILAQYKCVDQIWDKNRDSGKNLVKETCGKEISLECAYDLAMQGYPYAQAMLGIIYKHKEDYLTAAKWFSAAASEGYSYAQLLLGNLFRWGNSKSEFLNYQKALDCYQISAKQDDLYASVRIAEMIEFGIGTKKNYKLALEWLSAAEEILTKKSASSWTSYGKGHDKVISNDSESPEAEIKEARQRIEQKLSDEKIKPAPKQASKP